METPDDMTEIAEGFAREIGRLRGSRVAQLADNSDEPEVIEGRCNAIITHLYTGRKHRCSKRAKAKIGSVALCRQHTYRTLVAMHEKGYSVNLTRPTRNPFVRGYTFPLKAVSNETD